MDEKSIWLLTERAKELECVYSIDEVLQDRQLSLPKTLNKIVQILPSGFAQTEDCRIQIELYGVYFSHDDFKQATYLHKTPIFLNDKAVGSLEARYLITDKEKQYDLLQTEVKIMSAVADRISQLALNSQRELNIILDMLQKVNPEILESVCQKLQVYINGLEMQVPPSKVLTHGEINTPLPKSEIPNVLEFGHSLVARASDLLSIGEIYELIDKWIQEEWLFSLVKTIGRKEAEVSEILDIVQSYKNQKDAERSYSPMEKWVLAELSHRFLTTDEILIDRVIDNILIEDFEPLLARNIGSSKTSGGIGGKGAGLFIAEQILKRAAIDDPLLADIKTPRTWYLATDQLDEFLKYNNMEELNMYKYHSISYIRMTYDDIVSKIKNLRLSPHIMQTLTILLDDLDQVPIIVRSSSILEDRSQSAFSGKYKSLYLSNQGTKQERLDALTDAILEVYSSQYNPDSFQYREKRHLLHVSEKMGVLIQEVVGTKVGPYYMPLYAGVAFSENPLCWSPRITREGGLVRIVMGLGTRAVDRVNNDYPLLFSPENPGFKINQNPNDVRHYSQKYIDVMNLESGSFETVEVDKLLKTWGHEIPQLSKLVSVYHDEYIQKKNFIDLSPKKDDMVITFDGILEDTDFPKKISHIFSILKEKMGIQVDIEFAYDGKNLILLQCRTLQGFYNEAATIPSNIPIQDILFTANRFVSNGKLENLRYIVYVDGDEYSRLSSRSEMLSIGEAVGKLNVHLPHKKYILMGPGRWGSRGDIQLGVRVTYADICNTAMLIEIAKKKQSYVPEVSFGTHFFQDLVESNIAYLPLYPDDKDIMYREYFLKNQPNHLEEILPEYKEFSNVLRVIDVAEFDKNKALSIYMNAKQNKAVAFLSENRGDEKASADSSRELGWRDDDSHMHWRWRKYMAEQIVKEMDFAAYGIKGVYLFGSTDEETAGLCSDIDLLIHYEGNEEKKNSLSTWLDGWSIALERINYLRTGSSCNGGLLDVHFVTDEDISNHNSFATKINSLIYPATPLRINQIL